VFHGAAVHSAANDGRDGPPGPFEIEVHRKIERGHGSTYRVNGKEWRARDVQLLFADAATGSRSPALVRQGQISEIISAKPQSRRRILEDAAGIAGLHSRRHEAELRLRAAETNLSRLDDIARELDSALNRLRREARNAERYRRLSGEIRTLQSAVLHARWSEAGEAVRRLSEEEAEAVRGVEDTARAAAGASARSARAEAAMPALRDAETLAAAVLNKLAIDRDRLEHASHFGFVNPWFFARSIMCSKIGLPAMGSRGLGQFKV
jgi:chromosome segregation protein